MLASSSENGNGNADAPELCSFDYAIVRVVPRVEREEFFNVGAIVFCAAQRFLRARIELDLAKLRVLAPGSDAEMIESHLRTISLLCSGGRGSGPVGALGQTARFHWIVAPRSTIIQTSPTHSGLCHDPDAALHRIFESIVRTP